MPPVTAAAADRIRWDVIEEHLDEAAFGVARCAALRDSPLYTLDELRDGPEERLAAHVDGLVIGGAAVAERTLWPLVEEGDADEPDRVTAAALALAELDDRTRLDAVLDRIGRERDPEHRRRLADGVMLASRADVATRVAAARSRSPGAPGDGAWLRLLAARGGWIDAPPAAALADPEPATRRAAIAAAGVGTAGFALAAAEPALADPEPSVVLAAARVATIHGSPIGWSRALQLATSPGLDLADTRRAMVLVAVVGEPAHVESLVVRLSDAAVRPAVLFALGVSGRPAAAEAVLPWLDDPACGASAAEAFAAITGLPVAEPWFVDAPEAGEAPAFDDDDLDADLVGTPDDDLPQPDPAAIRSWWLERRAAFDPGRRYLAGRPAHGLAYVDALATASVRRRHALALEVAIRTRGAHRIPTRLPATLQRGPLASLASVRDLDGQRPFARIS